MYHETSQKLAHMTDHQEFERMMSDILSSLGYSGIEPQGPGLADGGKDAIHCSSEGKIIFAYSLRKDWKQKFNEDLEKALTLQKDVNKFVFCINQQIPPLEKDKIKADTKARCGVEVDFFDIERIRVALDTNLKKIRQIYLGIQDNSIIRRRIKNILFDPRNEVQPMPRWTMLSVLNIPDAIGLFDSIKDEDLTIVCETQEEFDLLTAFRDSFAKFRKQLTEIDNYIFSKVGSVASTDFPMYWNKIGEYCKLRLVGVSEDDAEKRIKTWHITSNLEECRKVCGMLKEDVTLRKLFENLDPNRKEGLLLFNKIKDLAAFKF